MIAAPMKELTGRHVLFICLGFFGVMLAVNMLFVFYALSTMSGGEGGNAYQKGLDYNQVIEAARAQDALGWSRRIEAVAAGRVSIALADRNGAPVSGLALTGEIARPVADKFTRPLAFKEMRPGLYAAEAGALDAGNWVVSLEAARAGGAHDDIVYQARERLWLKPNS
jgi:nitrogen fixation protein FixH